MLGTPEIDASLQDFMVKLSRRSLLGNEEQKALLQLSVTPQRLKAGVVFSLPDDRVNCVCLVADGLLGSFYRNDEGDRQIIALHVDGDMADLSSMILDRSDNGLVALTDTVLMCMPHYELRALAHRYPMIASALWRDNAVDARVLAKWATNIGGKSARGRLAHLFCEMACRYEQLGRRVGLSYHLPMTQVDLAQATAMTAIHLNRVVMAMRREGVVEMQKGLIEILDWKVLTRIAGFDPRYLHLGQTSN